jgi:hypothetical protein
MNNVHFPSHHTSLIEPVTSHHERFDDTFACRIRRYLRGRYSCQPCEVSKTESDVLDENDAPIESINAANSSRITIEDWSQTGRGVRLNSNDGETVTLNKVHFV